MAFNFNGNTPKNILYNGLNVAKLIYNGVVVWLQKVLTTITGIPPLTLNNSTGENLVGYKVYGDSIQNGTPSSSNPVEIESVGDLITDSQDEHYGKYKIPIKVEKPNIFDLASMTFTDINHIIDYTKDSNSITFIDTTLYNNYMYTDYTGFLKPNTTYTVSAKVTKIINQESGTSAGSMEGALWLQANSSWDSGNKIAIVGKSVTYGEIITTFTTPADMSRYQYIVTRTAGGFSYKFENIMFVEGTYTSETMPDYEPYIAPRTANIYLNEPLRKIGNYGDYIDFETQKIYRNVVVDDDTGTLPIDQSYHGTVDTTGTTVTLPDILLNKGTNIIEVDTTITPSNMEVKYYAKGVA